MIYILEKIKTHWKIILGGIIILLILIFIYLNNQKGLQQNELSEEPIIMEVIEPVTQKEEINSNIFVDVKGSVKKPGVYELEQGSRVIDAINKSGGLTKDADTSIINLSKKLEDGNVIIIYTKNKIEEIQRQEVIIEYIEKECICPDENNNACLEKDDVILEDEITNKKPEKVSLNTASKEELMTLTGIGESKANDIIEYRNTNGNFKHIDELKNVSGIGDSIFEKIKDNITI